MNKLKIKISKTLLAVLVLSGCAFAIDAEYKNSLSKVELTKNSDSSYTINLYTQKKFVDPIKVIKKNDLNYYILLPETKNNSTKVEANNSDIREVSTDSYSYAGQDVNNGYTKINIKTTKPISFNVDIKNPQKQAYVRKTLPAKNSSVIADNSVTQKKNLEPETAEKAKTSNANTAKTETSKAKTIKQKVATEIKKNVSSLNVNKKAVALASKTPKETEVQTPKKEVAPVLKVDGKQDLDSSSKKEDLIQEEQKEKAEINDEIIAEFENALKDDIKQEDVFEEIEENQAPSFVETIINKLQILKEKVSLLDLDYKLVAILFSIGIVTFIVALSLLTRKQKASFRLKNKVELIDDDVKTTISKQKSRLSKNENNENNGEFFVFDKDVVQTGFLEPTTKISTRNYELSNYEPALIDDVERSDSVYNYQKSENEYEIIQKMLKEDNTIKVGSVEYDVVNTQQKQKEENKEEEKLKSENNVTSPIENNKEETLLEPEVLSRVEIAPEKGFMFVSYNNNISLVGYMFDDVFALKNLKCSSLSSYDIKYRVVDSDEFGDDYIVKVEGYKLLVNVAKKSMQVKAVL